MRHQKSGKHLGRDTADRMMLFRNQTTDLFRHGAITTTQPKAEETRGFAEQMITLGKKGTIHDRRQAAAFVVSKEIVDKLFSEIAPKYQERAGGYTRMTKLGPRKGDGAELVKLELV